MTTITNMPRAETGKILIGRNDGQSATIWTNGDAVGSSGLAPLVGVCSLNLHPHTVAQDLAVLLERARNIGYAQAQADMRVMLGIKE